MIKTKPLALAQKLKNIVDICEAADTEIENQKLIQKGALDAGKEHDGIEPAVVRKILARRKKLAKDPAETTRLEDLMTDYQFMLGEGREDARPWAQADDEVSRVMALTNTSKPPKIEAIKKALGCSQGKAHKLRSIAAVRLAKKSSSSTDENEHEHSPKPEDGDDGITVPSGGPVAVTNGGGDHDAGHLDDSRRHQSSEDSTDESLAAGVAAQTVGGDDDRRRLNAEPGVARVVPPASCADDAITEERKDAQEHAINGGAGSGGGDSHRERISHLLLLSDSDDPGPTLDFLRGPSPANRRVA